MGVCLEGKNCEANFNYSTFNVVRSQIAYAIHHDLGKAYQCLIESGYNIEMVKMYGEVMKAIISHNNLDEKHKDIIDFLYMSDCDGKISPATCKKIYDLMRNYSTPIEDVDTFVKLCLSCYNDKSELIWY